MDLTDPIGALDEWVLFDFDDVIVSVLNQELLNIEIDDYGKKKDC